MKNCRGLAFLASLLTSSLAIAGEITFDTKLIEMTADFEQETLEADFAFESTGEDAAVIKRFEAACSCLEAQISDGGRLKWEPGEKGTIKGLFKVGNLRGTFDKEITILMADGEEHTLTVRMTMPELLTIEPKTLKWEEGAEVVKKSFDITLSEEEAIKILSISGTNEEKFSSKLETVEEGKKYRLWVTPSDTEVRGFGLLRIVTDCKYKKHKNYQAFAVITKPKAAKSP